MAVAPSPFTFGSSLQAMPNVRSIDGLWYKGPPAQPWAPSRNPDGTYDMPVNTVSWDQADSLVFYAYAQTNQKGTMLGLGYIGTSYSTMREEVIAQRGQGAVSSPQQLFDYYFAA